MKSSQGLQSFFNAISDWEKESQTSQLNSLPFPTLKEKPARSLNPSYIDLSQTVPQKKQSKYNNYAFWDRFDPDKEISQMDKEDQTRMEQEKKKLNTLTKQEKIAKGLQLKEEGNEALKQKKYEEAIQLYSQSYFYHPNNAIVPANRALAHIFLEQYSEAEKYSTLSIEIDSKYTKAWLRRGVSRLHLNQFQLAIQDFKQVLQLEPTNKEAKQHLEKCTKSIIPKNQTITNKTPPTKSTNEEKEFQDFQSKAKKLSVQEVNNSISQTAQTQTQIQTQKPHTTQKIAIQEINSTESSTTKPTSSTKDVSNAEKSITTKTSKPTSAPTPTSASTPTSTLTTSTSTTPTSTTPTSTTSTTSTTPTSTTSTTPTSTPKTPTPTTSTSTPTPTTPAPTTSTSTSTTNKNILDSINMEVQVPEEPPNTSFQFEKDWISITQNPNHTSQHLFKYLNMIDPNNLPEIFKTNLSEQILCGIFNVLANSFISQSSKEVIYQWLVKLREISRFDFILMFLENDQKKPLIQIFTFLEQEYVPTLSDQQKLSFLNLKNQYSL